MRFSKKKASKQYIGRRYLSLRIAILIIAAAVTAMVFLHQPNDRVFASGNALAAVYRNGILEINVPYDEHFAGSGKLRLEILDPDDKQLGEVYKSPSTNRNVVSWRASISLEKDVPIEDLAWYRLKISSGANSRIVSLSEILELPVIRIFAQRSYAVGSEASVRVITTDSRDGIPLAGSRIKLELVNGEQSEILFSGRTDSFGTARVGFDLPPASYGSRQFRVTADTSLGRVIATEPVKLDRRDRILLTSDKPIYQPGQTMHLRALALDGPTHAAVANQPLTLEVEDGKGNKVFKKHNTTDGFGIAAADFELADEVNFGAYHVRAILGEGEGQAVQEKTVTVDRYTLPKFKLEISLDGDAKKQRENGNQAKQGGYYRPGDTVSGKLAARYMFGKPITNADVVLTLTTFDVQSVELARLTGKTDADGNFSFSSKLPDFLAGRSMQQGSAPVVIGAEVKDTASHTESKNRSILVSASPILIMAVPESGRLLPGLDNRVFILTTYPDGTPAQTEVSGNMKPSMVKTDESGVAAVSLQSDSTQPVLELTAKDSQGRVGKASVKLESQSGSQSLMLRTERAVYKTGDRLRLETFSTRKSAPVYIDVIKDGQTLLTRAIDTTNGHGELSLDLTSAMFGAMEVRAYQITSDAEPIVDRRLIYVDPADDLRVEVSADKGSYKPGEDATISFHATDRNGRPVSAALGVEIVDEAVFALSDKQPGFEKVFMYLEKELLTPRYEVHQFSFDDVLEDNPDEDHPLEGVRRERAAQVLFAAAGTVTDRDVQGEFGREAIESHRSEYATRYAQRVYQIAQRLVPELAGFYANHSPSSAGFEADLKAFAETSADHKKMIEDPWGNSLVGQGQISEASYVYLTLRSSGPDGRNGTADDVSMQIVAQRGAAGVQGPPVLIDGQVSVENAVIAGGRIEIKGTLKDESGDPVDRVLITARRRANGRLSRVYSDTLGRFTIPDLSPGRYELKFERDGFKTSVSRLVVLDAGSRGTLEAVLESRKATPISLSVYPYYSRRDRGEMELDRVALADGPINGRQLVVFKAAATGVPAAAPANEPRDLMGVNAVDVKEKKAENKPEAGGEPRVRSFFPETLYTNPALITDGQGRASIRVPVADSITTWRITSLASTVKGMLGSSTFPIKVFQDFFVDLDLPAAITQGDAISAPVAVYNYTPAAQQVTLDLRQDPWFSLEDDTATKQLRVEAGQVGVVYFRLKASKIGEEQLQVTAKLNGGDAGLPGDAVARTVNVLPNGEEKDVVISERLEGSVTRDVTIPNGAIPDASKIFVKFYPGALSQVVDGLDSILRMPGGCFEQTSSSTYPDVLAMDYLKTAKKITPEIQAKAEGYISLGYQRLVTFEVPGGGFSWFGQAPANKILTAYGLMEFSDMSRVHEVDSRLIERTQNWLASQQQNDGSFKPDTSFINEGATTHYNTDVLRITAYIGWSLATTGYKGAAVDKARQYCKSHATGKEDAYTLAVLANFAVDSGDRDWTSSAIDSLAAHAVEDQKTAYWKEDGQTPTSARNESADLETTALAAQALLKSGQRSGLAKKALDYLTSKKDSLGNWQTTQATILALKAFVLSFTKGANADTAGSVEVAIDGKPVQHVEITRDNNDMLQMVDLGPYTHIGDHHIALTFNGKGSLQYQIVGRYFLPWTGRAEGKLDPLSIQVSYDRTRLAQDEVATATARVKNNTPATAKMIMVDLGIPPGFEASADDFGALMDATQGKSGGKLEKYTITARQVILYFDGLAPNQRIEFSYKLRAKFPVRAQTFSSRVYEYYNPANEDKTRPVSMTVTAK